MHSYKISWSKNVNEKHKEIIRTQFTTFSIWASCLENLFHEVKLNMNL